MVINSNNIGERLKELRKEKRLTQEMLAEKAGITRPWLSNIEKGKTETISLETAVKLMEALGYNITLEKQQQNIEELTYLKSLNLL